jgi:hypothetical protein
LGNYAFKPDQTLPRFNGSYGLQRKLCQYGLESLALAGAPEEENAENCYYYRKEERTAGAEQLGEKGDQIFWHLFSS